MGAKVYGGPKWTVSPVYEGMLKEELDAAAARHPEIPYQPVLIDATYAGLLSGATDVPLVIPALNRDGDCLSDLVLPMFGSIAGAESVLLAFDEDYDTTVAMAEAPHGTAPALLGKDLANPLAMILACGALLRHAADRHGSACERASRAIYEGTLETVAAGVKTPDLGGHAGTSEFTDAVVAADRDQARRVVVAGDLSALRIGRVGGSVRPPPYSYEHMFQSSVKRLRALLTLTDDLLGDPPRSSRTPTAGRCASSASAARARCRRARCTASPPSARRPATPRATGSAEQHRRRQRLARPARGCAAGRPERRRAQPSRAAERRDRPRTARRWACRSPSRRARSARR